MGWPKGKRAHNWKGGRVVDPRGYTLMYVGKDHPLADVRGYAYEHRLIAQGKHKRPLTSADMVRHDNRNIGDNSDGNLTVTDRLGLGLVRRKPHGKAKRLPQEGNPVVRCACGCGRKFRRYDSSRRPRWFKSGHNLKSGKARSVPR
jgi:hypothetical protein